ncbi:hypothetical protein BLNAU_16785 [Blattamonas nauphoetae]|uniref:Uncharacterized protein n=1 Tax=Blattamonas nauphoetae TaxID=2049346 RepID=A0ABQ9XBK8_9EUKA|nr:hypothetical protein BLNAU_16785 [Blattamonas nauphoetae]
MSQSAVFKISYKLLADPNAPENFGLNSSMDVTPTDGEVEMNITGNILDLYDALARKFKDTHVYITIQFPCSEGPLHKTSGLYEEGHQYRSHAIRIQNWKDLVGSSGFGYNPSQVTINDLKGCWPVQEDGTPKPMTVVAIPKEFITQPQPLDSEDLKGLTDRLHLLSGLHDLFYTKPEGRIISVPTLDSTFQVRQYVWIRDCWQLFQDVVIKNFQKFPARRPITVINPPTLQTGRFKDRRAKPSDKVDEKLWKSIKETPEWVSSSRAYRLPFEEDLREDVPTGKMLQAVYVSGQPGTGKSQMLIYLIYCLMQRLDKVAILYILPNQPVITILIDHSDLSNPVRVRCHSSSLGETWYTKGFPVIRIVDSVDPFTNETMDSYFTVYAASPTQYEKHMENRNKAIYSYATKYPFWEKKEFYSMMRSLGMTDEMFWMRRVDASLVAKLHPFLIRLLGAHGHLVEEADDPAIRRHQAQPSTEERLTEGEYLPPNNLFVCLNVIEVFGLNPRALGPELNTNIREMSKVFGWDEIALTEPEASLVLSSLAASHYSYEPVSEFASRLLAVITRIKTKGFIRTIHDYLEHDVNQELIRSHSRFTIFPSTPTRFCALNCTFPVIDHRPLLSFQLPQRDHLSTSPFDPAQALLSNVLYYETRYDPLTKTNGESWTGIDSFIFFHDKGRILLFTFQNTLNCGQKDNNYRLVEILKKQLENQHAIILPEPNPEDAAESKTMKGNPLILTPSVDVFFNWIVAPDQVKLYLQQEVTEYSKKNAKNKKPRTRQKYVVMPPYHFGVVSVADLLFNTHSRLDALIEECPKVEHRWTPNSQEFKDCFAMMADQSVDRNDTIKIELQLGNGPTASTNDDESESSSEEGEEETETDRTPPRKTHRTTKKG